MKTTTEKQPHQYLGLTTDQYQMDCMSQFMRWCMNWAKKYNMPLQSLLANKSMAIYYSNQFLELEHNFMVVAQKLDGLVDYTIMLKNYDMIMVDIYTNYPSALIEEAKKMKIENPKFDQN